MESRRTAVHIVEEVLKSAFEKKASDIHFLPQESSVEVLFRVDGILALTETLSSSSIQEIIARLKVLSGLKSDEHFRPQDGRFVFVFGDEKLDVRLSIVPTYYGENAVLRLLSRKMEHLGLDELGFSFGDIVKIKAALNCRSGIILLTGPTGSGKTSTLYSLIRMLRCESISIITLEDPVEYALSGITQIQIYESHGVRFASALRAVLRQDPDVIMVGEIRDTETASVAINAALTGHLILSTLHTSDSVGALPRLMDMGIPEYLIAGSIKLVIAQRLVRRLSGDDFSGRVVLAETLPITPALSRLILQKSSLFSIRKAALKEGMTAMFKDGEAKVEQGITTLTEVLRVLHE